MLHFAVTDLELGATATRLVGPKKGVPFPADRYVRRLYTMHVASPTARAMSACQRPGPLPVAMLTGWQVPGAHSSLNKEAKRQAHNVRPIQSNKCRAWPAYDGRHSAAAFSAGLALQPKLDQVACTRELFAMTVDTDTVSAGLAPQPKLDTIACMAELYCIIIASWNKSNLHERQEARGRGRL